MQPAQLDSRVGAKLIDQHPPGVLVGGQRLPLAAIAVQGEHQHGVQTFPQRIGSGQALQVCDHVSVTAQMQVRVDQGLEGLQPHLGQAWHLPES